MTTHRPYPESPEAAARNERTRRVFELVESLVVNDAHRRRACVRIAGAYGMSKATDDEVRAAVAYTTPPRPAEFIEPPAQENDAA